MRKTCLNCGTEFHVRPSHYDRTKYCSKQCMAEHYKVRLIGDANPHYSNASERVCRQCGATFHSYESRQFCSLGCYTASDQKKEDARRANDAARKPAGVCKRCGSATLRNHVYCAQCNPNQSKRIGVCLHCGALTGHNRDIQFCSTCRATGVHKVPGPISICQACGETVHAYKRKYCDVCWRRAMSAPHGGPRKVDANQKEIVDALREVGCGVIDMSSLGGGVPDLCIAFRDSVYLLEVKNPKARGKLNKLQEKWHETWRGHVAVVTSVEEALQAIGVTA